MPWHTRRSASCTRPGTDGAWPLLRELPAGYPCAHAPARSKAAWRGKARSPPRLPHLSSGPAERSSATLSVEEREPPSSGLPGQQCGRRLAHERLEHVRFQDCAHLLRVSAESAQMPRHRGAENLLLWQLSDAFRADGVSGQARNSALSVGRRAPAVAVAASAACPVCSMSVSCHGSRGHRNGAQKQRWHSCQSRA